MNYKGIIASFLLSTLSQITNLEHTSQYKLVNDPTSNRLKDPLIKKTAPNTLYDNLLTFLDTDEKFELN